MCSGSRGPDHPKTIVPKRSHLCGFAALRENKNEGG